MGKVLLILVVLCLTACGSFRTVVNSDQKVSADLRSKNTYCDSIPRVYSGVAYDFCCLHSQPRVMYIDGFTALYLMDGLVSAVVDTVLLPYTSYQHYMHGSLIVR